MFHSLSRIGYYPDSKLCNDWRELAFYINLKKVDDCLTRVYFITVWYGSKYKMLDTTTEINEGLRILELINSVPNLSHVKTDDENLNSKKTFVRNQLNNFVDSIEWIESAE